LTRLPNPHITRLARRRAMSFCSTYANGCLRETESGKQLSYSVKVIATLLKGQTFLPLVVGWLPINRKERCRQPQERKKVKRFSKRHKGLRCTITLCASPIFPRRGASDPPCRGELISSAARFAEGKGPPGCCWCRISYASLFDRPAIGENHSWCIFGVKNGHQHTPCV